jgi:SAM-dependent methyltransferase
MPDYASFAAFYDALMNATDNIELVSTWIGQERPGARSLLELGCGTGSILAGLTEVPSLVGLDRSAEMLAIARTKIPRARLIEGDMASFSLGERFDVIICMFDTINHLTSFDSWRALFERVHEHLTDDGLFIFDVNTIGKLRALGNLSPGVLDFDGNVMIMDVEFDGHDRATWDIRVFERLHDQNFVMHHERIGELAVPLDQITAALQGHFDLLYEYDPGGGPATDDSGRVYFVCKHR